MAGAAPDARKASLATGHAARPPELTTGTATATREAALPARTTIGTAVLATEAAVSVGIAPAPARVLFEDDVCRRWTRRCRSGRERFGRRHRRNSNRRSNRASHH